MHKMLPMTPIINIVYTPLVRQFVIEFGCELAKQLVAWAAIFAAVVAALFYPTVANCFKFLSAGSAEIGFFRYAVTAAVWTLHAILPS